MSQAAATSNSFWLVTAISSAATTVLFLALTSGGAMTPIVGYFVQLPLFFAGLAFGLNSTAIASLMALLAVGLIIGLPGLLLFAVVHVVPVLAIVRAALWSREGPEGGLEWYPAGLLLGRLTILVAAVTVIGLVWIYASDGSIADSFEASIDGAAATLLAQGFDAGLADRIKSLIPYMPGLVAASWMVMIIVNAILAQWLAARQEQALRPSPRLYDLEIPAWLPMAFALAVACASVSSGDLQIFGLALAFVMSVPLLLQGLAVIHMLAGRLLAPRLALGSFYLAILLFAWPLLIIVFALGMIECFAKIRQRIAQA